MRVFNLCLLVIGLLVTTLLVGLIPARVGTQPLTPRAALERLFVAERILAEWFAPAFLAEVQLSRVEQIVAELKRTQGPYQRVEGEGIDYTIVFERAVVPARIRLDAEGRIEGLFFFPARARITNLEQAVQSFRALPGRVGLLILEDRAERGALNPEMPLGVGSAFKLAVLATLNEQIRSGQRSWRDVVELRPEWKSLASGILQQWPDGSPLSVHTLSSLMISVSDNTATDVLINVVGRGAVEALAPPRNRPFLTTREAFILKMPRNQDLLSRYRAGNEAARREILADIRNRPLPTVEEFEAAFSRGPAALDVEWFFTARELCDIIGRVAELPLMGINPGAANRRDWARVAFKGGSEPGVLNLTTFLQAGNRKTYCVAVTWNNDANLEERRLDSLYAGLIDALK
ncbi:MAG: serine hydrolase [bacterium]